MTQLKSKPSPMNENENKELDDGNIPSSTDLSDVSACPDKQLPKSANESLSLTCDRSKVIKENVNAEARVIPSTENTTRSREELTAITIMSFTNSPQKGIKHSFDAQQDKNVLVPNMHSQEVEEDGHSNMFVDSQSEPGKYVFQLLPQHCIKGKGGRKIYKCDVCGGIYRHAFSLKRHYLRSHLNYDYLSEADLSNCSITLPNNGFKKSASLMENKKKERNSSKSPVTVSLERLPIAHDVKKTYTSAMPGLYRCHTCGKLFDELKNLKYHVTNHPDQPNNRRYSCPQCDMTFSHRQNLVRHLSVHSGEKPYACRYCGKCFPTATNQKRHERIHEGVKPYVCSHCSSVFTQSGDLKKHIRKQHGQHFHPCAFCVKYFSSEKGLADHVLGHGESFESNAKILGKRNGSLSSFYSVSIPVTRRIKVEKTRSSSTSSNHKYSCSICLKRFKTFLSLSRHRRSAHSKGTRGVTVHVKHGASVGGKLSNSAKSSAVSRSPKYNDDIILRDPPATEADFYADIAYNISDNLLNHLDGKLYIVQQPTPPTEDELQTNFGDRDSVKKNLTTQLSWSQYNFPPNFQCEQDDRDSSWCSDASCSKTDCEAYDLSKPRCCESPCDSMFIEPVNLSHSEMMHSLALSPVTSESTGEIPCIDGVLDLSMPHKTNNLGRHVSVFPRGVIEFEVPKTFVCLACGESYPTLSDMDNHKINNHPNVYCTHIELEGVKDLPLDLFKQHCSPIGVLKNCSVPPASMSSGQLVCTKCQWVFSSVPELHSHMLDCGGHKEVSVKHRSNGLPGHQKSVKRGLKRKLEETPFKRVPVIINTTSKKLKKGFVLSSKSYLDNKSGSEQSKYKCDGCERRFNYLSGLERHKKGCPQKLALGKRTYEITKDIRQQHSCPNCCRSFTYLASLKKHVLDCAPRKETKSSKTKNVAVEGKPPKTAGLGKMHGESEGSKSPVVLKTTDTLDSPNKVEAPVTSVIQEEEVKTFVSDDDDDEVDNSPADEIGNAVEESVKLEAELLSEREAASEGLMLLGEVCEGQACLECIESPPNDIKEERDEGDENDEKPGLVFHACPHCYRTYTYLANFKKHVNEACPLRKDLPKTTEEEEKSKTDEVITIEELNDEPMEALPSATATSIKTQKDHGELEELPTKEKEKQLPVGLPALTVETVSTPVDDGTPCSQSKVIDNVQVVQPRLEEATAEESLSPDQSKTDRKKIAKLQPYCCPTCHRIFFSYVKLLQHQLSHKLNIVSDVGDDGDETSTEPNQHLTATCSVQTSQTVLPVVHPEISTSPSPSSSAAPAKNKGGWPKGKSRKGYVAKNKRNSIDNANKDATTVASHKSVEELSNGEINDSFVNKEPTLLSATKRVPSKNSVNGKKAKIESDSILKMNRSKKENDHQAKKQEVEVLDSDGEIRSNLSEAVPAVAASQTAPSRIPLESQGNNTPNTRAKRLSKPRPKKRPSACLVPPFLPSSSATTVLEAVGPTANS